MARNILVIKLGALGDFIQALGPMAAIRRHHPDDHITLLTTKSYVSMAQACGYFNDILIDERPKFYQWSKWLTLRGKLNERDYARVYDLQNNDRTSFYFHLFHPEPEWVGIAKGASHRNNSPERTAGSAFDGHVQTLRLAGITFVPLDRLEWVQGRSDFPGLMSPYVLLVPGSAANRPEKRWPAEHYAQLAEMLSAKGLQPVLIGSDAERETLNAIHALCPAALNLGGQTSLFDIVVLARGAAGAVGNDTGPMHMIAPTGCPCIVLFSKNSNPKRHAPIGHDVLTIQKEDLKNLPAETVWKAYAAQHAMSS